MAEIFLQQTNASKVSDVIRTFTSRFPDWNILAKATETEIESAIFPLGLYRRRAKTIHSLANAVVKLGGLPHTRQGLEKLPGIGQYIANVLLVVLQDRRLPFLDTNMSRVLERFFGPREMADIRYDPYLQTLARKIANVKDSLSANWMVLDFAAIICTKRHPQCLGCPLSGRCGYARKVQVQSAINSL
jgi:A/G-specific adenine glycosylase